MEDGDRLFVEDLDVALHHDDHSLKLAEFGFFFFKLGLDHSRGGLCSAKHLDLFGQIATTSHQLVSDALLVVGLDSEVGACASSVGELDGVSALRGRPSGAVAGDADGHVMGVGVSKETAVEFGHRDKHPEVLE